MTNRPPRRTLVRWNDDHDKELLLWIAYCCNEQGIKIPFDRIAQCMGPSFTEGACIQHLAKIRTRMEEQGLHVPPAQKRGTVTRAASSIYRPVKAKGLNAPVPRVRADVPPPQRGPGVIEDEDDDGFDEHQGLTAPPIIKTPRKTARRQATLAKKPVVVKFDSDEDDPEPALYDSDNEYGAKRSSEPPTSQSPLVGATLVQKKLNFGENKAGASKVHAMQDSNYHLMRSDQDSPQVKHEAGETLESIQEAVTAASAKKPRGVRRKSSALTAFDDDENDGEYDPGNQGSKGRKKPRSRATKKSKASNVKETAAEAQDRLARSIGYQNASSHDIDREMMPPPPRPNVAAANTYANPNANVSAGYGIAWNHQFMAQPFGPSNDMDMFSLSNYGGHNTSDGGWNDYSPTASSQFDNLAFLQGGSFPNTQSTAFAVPTTNYSSGMASTNSSPATRNHSWASATSTSTVESQPTSWDQPRRTGAFPNPREATAVMHKMLNTDGANASTRIDIFGSPLKGADVQQNTLDQPPIEDLTSQDGLQDFDMNIDGSNSLFVGEPELFTDETNLNDWFEGRF